MYEFLMIRSEVCAMKAAEYAEADDVSLAQFYYNAALGFKIKAEALSVNYAVATNDD